LLFPEDIGRSVTGARYHFTGGFDGRAWWCQPAYEWLRHLVFTALVVELFGGLSSKGFLAIGKEMLVDVNLLDGHASD
jgi:hypothetical protein